MLLHRTIFRFFKQKIIANIYYFLHICFILKNNNIYYKHYYGLYFLGLIKYYIVFLMLDNAY